MLRPECKEVSDRRIIASLDVGAEELATLAEADGVNGWCRGENLVRGEVVADFRNMICQIAEEGSRPVARRVLADADEVNECAGVGLLDQLADAAKAFRGVIIAETW